MMQRSKDMTDVLLQRAGENRNSPVLNVRWDDQKVSYLVTVAINVRLNWLDAWASSMK